MLVRFLFDKLSHCGYVHLKKGSEDFDWKPSVCLVAAYTPSSSLYTPVTNSLFTPISSTLGLQQQQQGYGTGSLGSSTPGAIGTGWSRRACRVIMMLSVLSVDLKLTYPL